MRRSQKAEKTLNSLSFFSDNYFRVVSMMKERDAQKAEGKRDGEKILMVSDQAVIKQRQKTIRLSDLEVGDTIVIVGSPNGNGHIEAKMVRVFPF